RLVRPREPSLVAKRLGKVGFAVFASEAYLARRPRPRTLGDLGALDWIGLDKAQDALPQVAWLRRSVPALRYGIRGNGTVPQAKACAAGLGLALLPSFVSEPGLVNALPKAQLDRKQSAGPFPERDAWLVVHQDMRANARVAAMTAWLGRTFGGT